MRWRCAVKSLDEFRADFAAREEEIRARKAEKQAKYRAAHREELRAYKAKYDAEHHAEERAYRAAYNARNPRARRARDTRYEAKHVGKIRARKAAYYLVRKAGLAQGGAQGVA
jgi:hydroxylamine reductase (hybrid-cluster protein)